MGAPVPVVFPVVEQHAEEAAFLWTQRRNAVVAPNVSLRQLARLDERLDAHLDGVRLANEAGDAACSMQLAGGDPGSLFVAAALAVEAGNAQGLQRLLALSEALPPTRSGLFGAFGWSRSADLRGLVAPMLGSTSPFQRWAGTAACSMHRVDPGIASGRVLEDPDPVVRARGLRAAGELGQSGHMRRVLDRLEDDDPACRFWAAWSAVLLGDRQLARERLLAGDPGSGPEHARAFQLAMLSMDAASAHGELQRLARAESDGAVGRDLILGSAYAGDPRYVAWLIGHMGDDRLARLAGGAFSLITGVDLSASNLRRQQPEELETGPNDDPADANVDSDPDEGLPWPDPAKVETWWRSQAHRFQTGVRYFMGSVLNQVTCRDVLRRGYQSQRVAASLHLSLLNPGTPLFEWRSPARRQARWLASMT